MRGLVLIRVAMLVLSAVSAGLTMGRKAAVREVEKRKDSVIETASFEARRRIRAHAQSLVSEKSRAFLRRILIKALILSAIWLSYWGGYLPGAGFRTLMSLAIGSFILFDFISSWPTLRLLAIEIRKHGLRPKRAISEMVAARVFEEVLVEIDNREEARWHQKLVLGLAGRDMSSLSAEIAEAVAETARETSWEDIRPYLVSAALRAGSLMLLYSAFASLMVFRASTAA